LLARVLAASPSEAAMLAYRPGAPPAAGPHDERLLTETTVPSALILSNPRNLSDRQRQMLAGLQVLRGWNVEVAEGMFGPATERDVGALTGLEIPASARGRYQLGFPGDFATVAQSYEGQFGFLLAPGGWPRDSFVSDNVPLYWAVSFEDKGPAPFTTMESVLEVQFELQVPSLDLADGEVMYIEFNLLFVDQVSGDRIGIINVVFDPRGIPPEDSVLYEFCDLCTNSLWMGTSLQAGKEWTTMLPGTNPSQSETWRGFEKFGFSISASQFEGMIQDLLDRARRDFEARAPDTGEVPRFFALSPDPRDYRFSVVTFGVEAVKSGVATGESAWAPESHLALSARGIQFDRITP
jgi:hypothetical protein